MHRGHAFGRDRNSRAAFRPVMVDDIAVHKAECELATDGVRVHGTAAAALRQPCH